MKKCFLIVSLFATQILFGQNISKDARMEWWREARFGMFIHWGLYSLLARGEWVMHNEKQLHLEHRTQ